MAHLATHLHILLEVDQVVDEICRGDETDQLVFIDNGNRMELAFAQYSGRIAHRAPERQRLRRPIHDIDNFVVVVQHGIELLSVLITELSERYPQKICPTDDADQIFTADHRNVMNLALLKNLPELRQRLSLVNRDEVLRHDLGYGFILLHCCRFL